MLDVLSNVLFLVDLFWLCELPPLRTEAGDDCVSCFTLVRTSGVGGSGSATNSSSEELSGSSSVPGSNAFLSDTGSDSELKGWGRGILNVESRCLCGPFLRVSRYEAKLASGLAAGRIIPERVKKGTSVGIEEAGKC